MRSADEVTLVDAVYGTNCHARATTGTERVIYGCKIIDNLDSAFRTGLLTLHTTDTTVGAGLSGYCALVVI